MPRRLVCVVEGHGEVDAAPVLCARILHAHGIGPDRWVVDRDPIRQPRGQLVAPGGNPREDGLAKVVRLVRARHGDAAVVLVDADSDCPGGWGPAARAIVARQLPGCAVMPVREYEAWLLAGHRASDEPDAQRNPKALAGRRWPGYSPTTHQRTLTQSLDVAEAERRSPSFAYLVRELRRVVA